MNLENLGKKVPYKWKIQTISKNKTKAQCVAYIDARDVMNILDEAVGAENWQDDYKLIGDSFMAGIGIYVNDKWIWKWDTGTEGNYEKEKSLISDSFKRAGVKWGIGRWLYDMSIEWLDMDPVTGKPINLDGKPIYDVTEYIERRIKSK